MIRKFLPKPIDLQIYHRNRTLTTIWNKVVANMFINKWETHIKGFEPNENTQKKLKCLFARRGYYITFQYNEFDFKRDSFDIHVSMDQNVESFYDVD